MIVFKDLSWPAHNCPRPVISFMTWYDLKDLLIARPWSVASEIFIYKFKEKQEIFLICWHLSWAIDVGKKLLILEKFINKPKSWSKNFQFYLILFHHQSPISSSLPQKGVTGFIPAQFNRGLAPCLVSQLLFSLNFSPFRFFFTFYLSTSTLFFR